jgi:hypothetical protein
VAKKDAGTRAGKRDKGIVKLTSGDGIFGPGGFAQRVQATVYGAVGSLPRALRGWAAVICHAANLGRLTEAMTLWIRGGHLDREQFARLFLGRDADDPLIDLLCSVAPGVARATGHAELGDAAAKIAAAIQMIGPDRWPRFLAELEKRALDPAIVAAVEEQRADPPGGHAIHPDRYPETAPSGSRDAAAAAAAAADADAIDGGDQRQADSEADRTADSVGHQGVAHQGAGARSGEEEHPRPWGGRSSGPVPPVRNPARLKPGTGSRPSASGASLWDEQGGEWRYHPDDAFHYAHWDYNDHAASDTPWRSIPVKNASPWKR